MGLGARDIAERRGWGGNPTLHVPVLISANARSPGLQVRTTREPRAVSQQSHAQRQWRVQSSLPLNEAELQECRAGEISNAMASRGVVMVSLWGLAGWNISE